MMLHEQLAVIPILASVYLPNAKTHISLLRQEILFKPHPL